METVCWPKGRESLLHNIYRFASAMPLFPPVFNATPSTEQVQSGSFFASTSRIVTDAAAVNSVPNDVLLGNNV